MVGTGPASYIRGMPLRPPMPTTLPPLVDAFEETVLAVIELGRGCSAADFELPTACPGWTVKDQISHVADIESILAGDPEPVVDVPPLAHVRNDFGVFMERGVQARRGVPGPDVVAELTAALPRRLAALRAPGLTAGTPVDQGLSIELPARTASELMVLRVRDIWAHEQDLRAALGKPGGMGAGGAVVFLDSVFGYTPQLVARRAKVPVGQTVVVEAIGAVAGECGVRVEERPDGKPAGVALDAAEIEAARRRSDGVTWVTLDTAALTRRAAGRCPVDETGYAVRGSDAIARAVLESLVITP